MPEIHTGYAISEINRFTWIKMSRVSCDIAGSGLGNHYL
jgi:hypothetical protein